jgi:hypothetical protein
MRAMSHFVQIAIIQEFNFVILRKVTYAGIYQKIYQNQSNEEQAGAELCQAQVKLG